MTTEMKQLLALLLLGCVFAVHGGEKGAEKKGDPCRHGKATLQLFIEYQGCPDPNPFEILGLLLRTISSNMTVNNMNNLFTSFCSALFPRMKQCFQRNIQKCSLAQRNSLMRVVQQSGFVCEPNTNRIHHVINHLLAKLTDADLAKNEACDRLNLSMITPLCLNESLKAIGVNVTNRTSVFKDLSLEQLAPKFQTITRTMMECMINQIHHHHSSCPQWRGKAISIMGYLIIPPLLGQSMPFTEAELDRLFRWQSGAQSQMNVEQDFLQDLFK